GCRRQEERSTARHFKPVCCVLWLGILFWIVVCWLRLGMFELVTKQKIGRRKPLPDSGRLTCRRHHRVQHLRFCLELRRLCLRVCREHRQSCPLENWTYNPPSQVLFHSRGKVESYRVNHCYRP